MSSEEPVRVGVDQRLCTGDGLCVQYAPDVFAFDVDGLAYVHAPDGPLRREEGARVTVPGHRITEVLDAADGCPGACIHVERCRDGTPVAGPGAVSRR